MNIMKGFLKLSSKFSQNSTVRKMSFKVLSYDIDLKDPEIQLAEKRSKSVGLAMDLLTKHIKSGGGERAIHRHTVINKKLLVRERLKLLFDSDFPFFEIGLFAGMAMDYGNIPAAGTIVGIGKIHGQFCIVAANDATVKGGTFFPITVAKQGRMQHLSCLNKLPCIYLVDSGGAFLPLQAEIFPDKNHGGRNFYNEAVFSSQKIPQIAIVCGSSTAGGAYAPTMAEEAIIVNKSGVIFLGGPPLVKAATGEIVTEQELGGADMHCRISGCTDYYAENEEEAFSMCRESVLTLNLPQSPTSTICQQPLYPVNDLLLIAGKEKLNRTDMYIILSRILDGSMFKEFKKMYGDNLITGFGFIENILIGILANCNSLTYQDAQKGTHFIQLCEKRNIPLCFLQNSGDYNGIVTKDVLYDCLLNRAKMVATHSSAKVPKITLCVSGCYEDDNFTMCGWDFEPNFFISWPLTHISHSRDSIEMAKSIECKNLETLTAKKTLSECENLFDDSTSAFYKASKMLCDSIIAPEDTRKVLSICLKIATRKLRFD